MLNSVAALQKVFVAESDSVLDSGVRNQLKHSKHIVP